MVDVISLIGSLVLGFTFLVSGVQKLRAPRQAVAAVHEYQVLPGLAADAYAWMLPVVECGCGVLLLLGAWPRASAGAALLLLATFLVGAGVNLSRGRTLQCHCFGSNGTETLSWATILRIAVLGSASIPIAATGVAGWHAAVQIGVLPAALLTVAGLSILYMIPTIPQQIEIWQTPVVIPPARNGGCVSYAAEPLGTRFHKTGGAVVLPSATSRKGGRP